MGRWPAAAALVLVAAACGGGSSSNGEAKKPAEQVVADARKAATAATSVHMTGRITDEGKPLTLDLVLVKGRGGKGTMTENGLRFALVRIGDDAYVRGSDAFLRAFGGSAAAAQLLHGRWLKGSATSGALAALTPLTDPEQLFKGALGNHGKLVNRGETELNGQKVVEIDDTTQGGRLYVAAEGGPLPVALRGGKGQGRLAFGDWNADATVTAPEGAVDLSQLSGK
jgi:hypothetical protein